jgi:hypothetical protein
LGASDLLELGTLPGVQSNQATFKGHIEKTSSLYARLL